jgi:hypothetical protein
MCQLRFATCGMAEFGRAKMETAGRDQVSRERDRVTTRKPRDRPYSFGTCVAAEINLKVRDVSFLTFVSRSQRSAASRRPLAVSHRGNGTVFAKSENVSTLDSGIGVSCPFSVAGNCFLLRERIILVR